jgi:hypothetical protein
MTKHVEVFFCITWVYKVFPVPEEISVQLVEENFRRKKVAFLVHQKK